MKAEIISIGTELLLGQIVDTNAAYLAAELPSLGIDCYFISQVGDNLERLVDTLRRAWERSDLILATGGLGPTEDDVTREAIAALLGETMVVQPNLEAELRARFARLGRPMPESNLKQATLIPSAQALPNPIGTAPGWWVERDVDLGSHNRDSEQAREQATGDTRQKRILVAMPGVPVEMRRMWQYEVRPRLQTRVKGTVIISRTLKVLGLGESHTEERIRHLLSSPNPTIGIYAKRDGIHLRLTAKAADEAAARAMIAPVEAEIRAALGLHIYGADDDTPQGVVRGLLQRVGLTVATAEYAGGGALAAMLGEVPASEEQPFHGGLLAASPQGLHALGIDPSRLDEDGSTVAILLARLARERLGTDIGLSLVVAGSQTMEALTKGGGRSRDEVAQSVYLALDDGQGVPRTATVHYATALSEAQRLGSLAAINLLRLHLLRLLG